MSKDEMIKKLEHILLMEVDTSEYDNRKKVAEALYDAGFRDVGELRNWLKEEKNKWKEEWDGYNNLVQNPYQEILNKLESL
jgi:hypothetical protein